MIYVNGRFLLQSLTGVNRFAYELCMAWVHLDIPFTLCCPPGEIKSCYDVSRFKIIICGWGKSHIWEQLALPVWFARIKGEKVLVNFTGLGPLLTSKKIMTIHDLAFMVNPAWYSKSYVCLYKLLTPLCASTSMRLLTVSEFSKNEIIKRLAVKEEKISVIYNAVSPLFQLCVNAVTSEGKYILAVSSIDPRKNFAILLKALEYIKDKNIKLKVVGGQDMIYSTSIKELSKDTCADKVEWLGRISDGELKTLYANALCFVYPSLYEGFGIPPLEAMSCGTPTIVSDIPPLREVCQDASLYINPYDAEDIANKINILAFDEGLRKDLMSKGYRRCSFFDWEKSAKKLAGVVYGCLKKNNGKRA